jgi:hypothetical protein
MLANGNVEGPDRSHGGAPKCDHAMQAIGPNRKVRRKSKQGDLLHFIDEVTEKDTTSAPPLEQEAISAPESPISQNWEYEPDAPVASVVEPEDPRLVDDHATARPDEIKDQDARRRVGDGINAMRVATSENARLIAIRDCSRVLDPDGHHDAFRHLTEVAHDLHDLPVDLIQGALAEGQRLRKIDLAADDPLPEPLPDENYAPPLATISASDWEGKEPPPLRWVVNNRLVRGVVSILSGDGAAGKTTIAMQLAQAVVRKADWFNAVIDDGGPVLFFSAEEEEDELHRRTGKIVAHHGIRFADLLDLHFHPRPGECALLGCLEKGVIKPTPLLAQITARALELSCVLIIIEAVADVFGGDEINRSHVRQFMTLMRQLARTTDAAVLLLQHPSLTGMKSGDGTAGSTHWNNAARSRLYFSSVEGEEHDIGLRELLS